MKLLSSLTRSSCVVFLIVVMATLASAVQPVVAADPPLRLPENDDSSGFVAVGELQRIRRDDGTRRMALIDESGAISAFVAPSARINLRQYVGQTVAVTAKSVTRGQGDSPNIMPERVTPLTARVPTRSTRRDTPVGTGVRLAAFDEPLDAQSARRTSAEFVAEGSPDSWEVMGDTIYEGAIVDEGTFGGEMIGGSRVIGGDAFVGDPMIGGGYLADGCSTGGCGTCTSCVSRPCGGCGLRCGGGCGSGCGPGGRLFVRGEFIGWAAKGMDLPPLVTTSELGTSTSNAGVLGLESTDILYGDNDVLTDMRSGFRIRFGGFFGPGRSRGWEAEYLTLGDEGETYEARSNGNGEPILARPFFNMNPRVNGDGALDPPPGEDAEIVSYPGLLSGIVTVTTESRVDSAGARFRWNFCCKKYASNGCCGCGPTEGYKRVDFTAGYRYFGVDDKIEITEDLTSLQSFNPGRFEISDRFKTKNKFNGAEVGVLWESGWRNWTLEAHSRTAFGNVHSEVLIDGDTLISPLTQPQQSFEGGLLTQRSNIGEYKRDKFGLLNELGLTLGLYLTPRLRATVGYTIIYLTPVVRAGDQIDLDLNPDYLAPEIEPFTGPERPRFAFRDTDFWVNGVNVGLDLHW